MAHPTSVSMHAVLLCALVGACGHEPRATHGPPPQPDGRRGHGWFETAWGVEEIDYEWRNGVRVYEGDLALDEDAAALPPPPAGQAALLSLSGRRWEMGPDGVVEIPYEIRNADGRDAATFDRTESNIRRAMTHWETYALRPGGGQLLRFAPHTPGSGGRYTEFRVKRNGGVCYVVLNLTGQSHVDSDPECRWQTYVHEIGHVLTFRHEQKRTDRPDHVLFHAERTVEDREFATAGGNWLGTDYDTRSIMHYPSCMFATSRCGPATSGAWVLERIRGTPYIEYWSERSIGEVLSPTDVCGTRTLYGLSCGGGAVGADAGVPDAAAPPRDAAVPRDAGPPMDAGIADAGVPMTPDGGVPMPGLSFPVSTAVAGMLQRVSTGECVTALGALALASCDELDPSHRWGLSPTEALRNAGSALCAEPTTAVAGANIEERDCVPEDTQRWRFADVELVNGFAGTCVAVPSSDYFDGQNLVHRPCSAGANQRFTFDPATHELLAQGWCLTAGAMPGERVELHECDGSTRQRWIETDGGFAADGLCLHIRNGADSAPGAVIDVADCNAMVGQMWGLRGHVAYFDDAFCLSPSMSGSSIELAECATSETMVWWPRATCVPLSCDDLGADCGDFDDGCGAPLACGECVPVPEDRDAGPGPREECIPLTCAELEPDACGMQSDGCDGVLDCGRCRVPPAASGCACRSGGTGRWGGVVLAAFALAATLVRRRRPSARE